jgi:hypothetical protein
MFQLDPCNANFMTKISEIFCLGTSAFEPPNTTCQNAACQNAACQNAKMPHAKMPNHFETLHDVLRLNVRIYRHSATQ